MLWTVPREVEREEGYGFIVDCFGTSDFEEECIQLGCQGGGREEVTDGETEGHGDGDYRIVGL